MRVIIIEDQFEWQDKLEEVFEEEGHNVVEVFDSREGAVEAITRYKPDMVVIDIQLGEEELGGVALARAISHLHVSVVYLTGHESDYVNEAAHEFGNKPPLGFIYKTDFFRNPHQSVRNLSRLLEAKEPTFILEEEGEFGEHVVERYSNVLWIHGEGKHGTIYCRDGKIYKFRGQKIRFMEQQSDFAIPFFFEASRNDLINIHQIQAMKEEGRHFIVYFDKNRTLPEDGIQLSVRQSQVFKRGLNALLGLDWEPKDLAMALKKYIK